MAKLRGGKASAGPKGRGKVGFKRKKIEFQAKQGLIRKRTSAENEPPSKRRKTNENSLQLDKRQFQQTSMARFVVVKKEVQSPGLTPVDVENDDQCPPMVPSPYASPPVVADSKVKGITPLERLPSTSSYSAEAVEKALQEVPLPAQVPVQQKTNSESDSESESEDCDDLYDQDFRANSSSDETASERDNSTDFDCSGETVKNNNSQNSQNSASDSSFQDVGPPPDLKQKEETEIPNLKQYLPYAKAGQRCVSRCCHPDCKSADIYMQRIERHYFTKHATRLHNETDDTGRQRRADALIKKYQKPFAKVVAYTTENTIKKCFSEHYYKREFLSNLRTFLVLHGIVVEQPKRESQNKAARLPPESIDALCAANQADDEDPDGDLESTKPQELTKEELGLLNHCSPNHPLLLLYIKHKSEMTKSANDPERACRHMSAQLSKIIGFVEAMQPNGPSSDGWDVLRDEGSHKEMIRRLYLSDFKSAGRQNYRKAIQDLIKFCLPPVPSQRNFGRIRCDKEANMPSTLEESIQAISMLWSDFTEPIIPVAGRTNESPVDLALVEDYFSDEQRVQEMCKNIETLSGYCDKPSMFVKIGHRYKPEVAVPFNAVTRYLACRLTTLCDRGGVPATATCEEFDNATRLKKKNITWYTFSVHKHKNARQGPLQLTVTKETYNLLQKWRGLREELKSVGAQFKNDILLVALNGSCVTKIYDDFNKWASTQPNFKGTYSSRTMRQHVTTQAEQYHAEKTVEMINKKQNHKKETANKDYVLKTREGAVNNTVETENVKLNDILTKEALLNLNWFAVKLGGKLPSRKDVETVMIERCTARKNLSCFKLTKERYEQIRDGVQRDLRQLTLRFLVEKLMEDTISLEECVTFLKSEEKQIGYATSWERTLKKYLEKYQNSGKTSRSTE